MVLRMHKLKPIVKFLLTGGHRPAVLVIGVGQVAIRA
jgi:hypothetical protein